MKLLGKKNTRENSHALRLNEDFLDMKVKAKSKQ